MGFYELLILIAFVLAGLTLVDSQQMPPNGRQLQIFGCRSQNFVAGYQQWTFLDDYTVRSTTDPTKCLASAGIDGAPVVLWNCNGSSSQKWHLSGNDKGYQIGQIVGSCQLWILVTDSAQVDGDLLIVTTSMASTWLYNSSLSNLILIGSNMCLDIGSPVPRPCDRISNKKLPFCDFNLSREERISDLLQRITLNQKIQLLANPGVDIPALGMRRFEFRNEALHGIGISHGVTFSDYTPYATSTPIWNDTAFEILDRFPQVIATAASFDPDLFRSIGEVVGTEGRAMSNVRNAGLTFWTPNLNIFRDPRWGRGQETPGEDPVLSAVYVKGFVGGMQSDDSSPFLRVSSCCKHFAAYSLSNWEGVTSAKFNAVVDEHDFADTYFPVFETCASPLGANASGVMCSYAAVNGVPSCANDWLLKDILKDTFNFTGYITSDCEAIPWIQTMHNYTNTTDQTLNVTLGAGVDMECPGDYYPRYAPKALKDGAVTIQEIDQRIADQIRVQFRLGRFDPSSDQPFLRLGPKDVNSAAHKAVAIRAAQESIVLLKNEGQRLPLSPDLRIAVLGPNVEATLMLLGNYYGQPEHIVSMCEGISSYAKATCAKGCHVNSTNTTGFKAACQLAQSAEITVLVMGIDQTIEREGLDRVSIDLPGAQHQFIQTMANCSSSPVVLVIVSGGGLDVTQERDNPQVGAIVWAGYGGQAAGQGLADVLFGKASPAGRLPTTWYPEAYTSLVPMTNFQMPPNATTGNPGRGYRYYPASVVFPFGFGLSYSQFHFTWEDPIPMKIAWSNLTALLNGPKYSILNIPAVFEVKVRVRNIGNVQSDVTILAFISGPNAGENGNPMRTLIDFRRIIRLYPGNSYVVPVLVKGWHLSVVAADGTRHPDQGTWTLEVEGLSQGIEVT